MKVMRQLTKFAAGAAVVAGAAVGGIGAAQADGMPSKGKVVYEKPYDWGGFYFGVHSGWAWSNFDATNPGGNPALQISQIPGASWGVDHDAPMVGGQIGLQHQFGNVVLGVEANLSTLFQDNYGVTSCPRQTIALFNCVARLDDLLTIGGRVGWAMGKWMPYVTGGYASAGWSAEARNQSLLPVATTIIQWGNGRNQGWYIGGGLDMLVAGNWTVGVEYRHYEFDTNLELARAVVGGVWGQVPNDNASFDTSADTVALKVSWKFGRESAKPLK